MNLLPADLILHVASFLPLESLDAYSRTDKYKRNYCGMLDLNALYTVALQGFIDLQNKFVFRCQYNEVPENPNTAFFGKFIKDADKKLCLRFDPHSLKIFFLEKNQFIATIKLGHSTYKDVEIPKNTGMIGAFYFQYINPDTANLVRTTTYPIKEIRCDFSKDSCLSKYETIAIKNAAKKAYENSNSISGGLM